ncbi:MAG TPA: hypothetical protein VEL76_26610, partial [Gemmataceae bacterium]|nr:hypothetical protein [Gemmataceae bacterium]
LARQPLKGARTEWKLPENLPVTPGAQLALVVSDDGEGGVTRVNETLQLVSSLFITHLTTDRPLYRPGEVVRFRSLTLERFSLKPGKEDFQLRYRITDPRSGEVFKLDGVSRVGATPASPDRKVGGGEIVGPDGKAIRGIGAGEWRIPPEAAGGEYILTVSEAHNRFPPERRKFLVNQYQAPRLNKELDFTRRSYGPGDVVEVNCKVARVEGGLPGNEPVIATAQVDGQPCVVLDDGALRLNQGAVTVRFKLPAQIERGDGSVSIQFKDGGTHETLVRPIPIVLKKLFVEFFPEGGYLIAGVPNRVYFTARTTLGKPAELQGRLVGPDGKEVIAVRTLNDDKEAGVNQGMGVFEFTPQAGKVYDLKIDSPIGIESRHQLRDVNDSGVALAIPDGVFTKDLDVVLHSAGATRKLLVGAYCRGRLLAQSSVTAKDRELIKVKLTPAAGVGGVYRVTVFEEVAGSGDPATTRLQARAERLVYRQPVERLNLNVQAGKESYAPGEQGTVAIKATDENGQPAPFIALVSVVDLSVLKLADEKTARSMPTHFFLTTEVRQPEDLEYADFLVGPHPKATAALDLLLGTQGWRRFAEQKKPGDLREEKQNAERLLVATGQTAPEERNLAQLQLRKVDHDFAPQWVEKQTTLATREAQAEEAAKQASREQAEAQQRAAQAAQAAEFATTRLKEHNQRLLNYALIGLAVVLLGVGVWGLVVGMIRMSNNHPRAVPSFVTGICSLSVLFLVGLGVGVYFLANQPRVGQMEMAGARMQAGGGGMAGMPFGNAPPQPMAMPDMGMDVPKEAAKEKMAFDPFMQVPMPAREDKKKDDRGAEQAPRERPEVVLLNDDFKFGNKKDKEALGDEALVKPGKDLAPFVAKRRPRPPMEQPPGMPGMPLGGEGKRADWDDAEGLPGGQGPGQWRAVEERRLR